jgi:Ser/Thr protein kinase RdoA (MazF antagonist)
MIRPQVTPEQLEEIGRAAAAFGVALADFGDKLAEAMSKVDWDELRALLEQVALDHEEGATDELH